MIPILGEESEDFIKIDVAEVGIVRSIVPRDGVNFQEVLEGCPKLNEFLV